MYEEHPQELIDWLESQYEGYTVMFGVPVFKTVKSAMVASAIGYRHNATCVLTEPVSVYLMGELTKIKLNSKFVFPS
jgi:hypothetical protein